MAWAEETAQWLTAPAVLPEDQDIKGPPAPGRAQGPALLTFPLYHVTATWMPKSFSGSCFVPVFFPSAPTIQSIYT